MYSSNIHPFMIFLSTVDVIRTAMGVGKYVHITGMKYTLVGMFL